MNHRNLIFTCAFSFILCLSTYAGESKYAVETIKTSGGDLTITLIGHASLVLDYNGKTIHADPWSKKGDYSKLPKADLILITHAHPDHLDPTAVKAIRKKTTKIFANGKSAEALKGVDVMKNGDSKEFNGIQIEAIAAYNIVHKMENGSFWHPKGDGNGYLLTIGDKRVLIAGDTENIPEIKSLENIDVAFLPMNVPYTMTPEMVADAVKAFKPKVLYPYHTGETDKSKLTTLLKDVKEVEVRVRKNM